MDRKRYMDILEMQKKNNDRNYHANFEYSIKYNKVNQTPLRPPDMRSLEEKLCTSNIHQIKAELFTKLSPDLLDGQQFQIVINELTDDEIIFIYQTSTYIINNLKPKFSIGMLSNQFINYIRRLKDNFESVEMRDLLIIPDKKSSINSLYENNKKEVLDEPTRNLYDVENPENIIIVKNNLFDWFKKYNHGLLYGIKTGFGSGWNQYTNDGCIQEFVDHAIIGIKTSIIKSYNLEEVNNYIGYLYEFFEILDKPRDEKFTLFRKAISLWYSPYKINFGSSRWGSILEYHFQYVNEDRFLRDEHITQLTEFIQSIIDILDVCKTYLHE
jgi:hypothetical protein